jgi:CheY-like chemotaxis protein
MATVLLADDSALIRKGVGLALEQGGFEVLFATDGEQALEIARGSSPDLILLDLFLPKLNGWDVLRALKSLPLTAKVPVIVLSSLAQSEASLGRQTFPPFSKRRNWIWSGARKS